MHYVRALVRKIREDDVMGLSAELAYRFLFSLFPLMLFVAALSAFVARFLDIQQPTDRLISMLSSVMPEEAASSFAEPARNVLQSSQGGLLSFGILAALFSATSAFRSLIKAMNRAYDVEETRPWWRQYAVALAMTVLAGVALIVGFVVLVAGQFVGVRVASELGVGDTAAQLINLARIPVVILMLMVATGFLYWALPAVSLPLRWVSAGGVAFVLVWLAATLAFAFYVSNFGNYNATYGALGGVIVLMLWLYITSFVMVLGAEINAFSYRQVNGHAPAPSEDASAADRAAVGRPAAQEPVAATAMPAGASGPAVATEARRVAKQRPVTAALGAAVGLLVAARLAR